ncbi:bilirubin oxidase, partial [Aaosphaeria arxii CBS 175.79]
MPYPRSWSTTRILLLFTLSSYGTRFANSLKIDGTWISPQYNYIFDFPVPFPVVKTPKFTYTNEDGADIDYYEVEVTSVESQIYPDLKATPLVGYDGTSPGPMFVMQRGREAVVRFTNNGPLNMAVHVHGQYNRAPFDGWAGDYATPGQYKDYYYPNAQNARTIWYHDHTEYRTGENVYRGQEGLYLIHDPEEQALALPSGNYDLPLSISAKTYNSDGSLWYNTNNNIGLWGDVIQINGQPWPYVPVEPRKYRLRILNGAVSRTFGLSFTAATEDVAKGESIGFTVIASDGGLFGAPVKTNYLAMAMGERYEIIFDFAQHRGQNITLRNARGMGENVDYAATDLVTRFVVGEEVTDWDNNGPVPPKLHDIPPANPSDTDKEFTFARVRGGRWNINGVGFADVENRILTRPERGKDEIWTLKNGAGDGTHPVHIHLIDFQVLERTGGRGAVRPYESAGMKDIVWLAGGETVKVLARYAPWPGVYMFHCHNLIHEDNDMLAAFDVAQLSDWGYDNSTMFIDPMTPEFRPKDATPDDFTDEAIREKLAWLYSTNPYN